MASSVDARLNAPPLLPPAMFPSAKTVEHTRQRRDDAITPQAGATAAHTMAELQNRVCTAKPSTQWRRVVAEDQSRLDLQHACQHADATAGA